jgi:glycosyltransferase involved in cell wall biosynthesis
LKLGLPSGSTLEQLWKHNRPDIVHIVTEGPLGWSALSVANRLGIPNSTDFHTNFHTYSKHYGVGWLHKPIAAYLRTFHNKARCTLVPTAGMRRELDAQGFANLKIVARGVDTRLFDPARRCQALRRSWGVAPEQTVVLYVGRVAAEKNLPLVLSTFEKMHALDNTFKLVLVGDGPQRSALMVRYPQHVFAGMRTGEDLATHYASGDIFLFPSTTETYGNVTVEAIASGLAVIAYDYAAAAEHICHGRNGLVADFDNAEEFSRLAEGLVNSKSRIRALGVAARESAQKIDWEHIYSEFEGVLQQVVANRVHGRA